MFKLLGFDLESTDLKASFATILSVGILQIDPTGAHEYEPKMFNLYDYKPYRGTFVPEGARLKDGKPMILTSEDYLLLQDVHAYMTDSDMWTGWYSKGFDIKMLNARMLLYGLPPLPPIPHLDLYFTAKANFNLHSNRLAAWQTFLKLIEEKTPLDWNVWRAAGAGELGDLQYVNKHCYQDTKVLRSVYQRLAPFSRLHPRVAGPDLTKCRVCGGSQFQSRGRKLFSSLTRTWKKQMLCVTPRAIDGIWGPCNSWNTITMSAAEVREMGW